MTEMFTFGGINSAGQPSPCLAVFKALVGSCYERQASKPVPALVDCQIRTKQWQLLGYACNGALARRLLQRRHFTSSSRSKSRVMPSSHCCKQQKVAAMAQQSQAVAATAAAAAAAAVAVAAAGPAPHNQNQHHSSSMLQSETHAAHHGTHGQDERLKSSQHTCTAGTTAADVYTSCATADHTAIGLGDHIRFHRFIFKDQYIEFTTNIPEDADLYGLGEVTLPTGFLLPRNGKTITMWARDFPCAFPDVNLYGSHPFYLQVNKGGRGWGHNGRVLGA
jgi:alpha-glucosidase (family GH31 glycosyl hydrolase)